jgi:hypothetical protein
MKQGADGTDIRELSGALEIAMSRNDGFEAHFPGSSG